MKSVIRQSMWRKLPLLYMVAVCASGCTTMRPVSLDSREIMETVRPGDGLRVITRDGRKLDFKVKEINEQRIVGEEEVIVFSDISQVERQEFSPLKTTGLVVGIAAVTFVVLGAIALSSLHGGSGSGLRFSGKR